MAKIPERDVLKELLEEEQVLQEHRPYIGMSGLMSPCKRRIWYDFRWVSDRYIPKRIARIFDRGDLEEARVIKDLEDVGMICSSVLGDQMELVDATGHIKGHPDGGVRNVPTAPKTDHLLEIKTKKHSLYVKYLKEGLKKSDPAYWGQVHTYMGEMKLTRCLFTVTNKDTEERNYERIKYDESVHRDCMSIGMDILTSEAPPKKLAALPTWFECKMCDKSDVCHKGAPIKKTCRSCKHVNIEMEGKWSCGHPEQKLHTTLSYAVQMKACDLYELDEVFE